MVEGSRETGSAVVWVAAGVLERFSGMKLNLERRSTVEAEEEGESEGL